MKINLRSFLLFLSALIVPLSSAICQDIKTEKKIKVVLDDGSGAKTVMDTTFTNGPMPDSVILKNGKVIYFAENMKEVKEGKSPEKLLVTVTSTVGDEKNKEQTIITTYENSDRTSKAGSDGTKHSYSYSSSGDSAGKSESQTIIVTDDDKDLTAGREKTIIIKDGKVIRDDSDKDFDTLEKLEKNDNHTKMTKYVIAKDGVVVTVESKDEAKAKDIITEIENKLGVSKEDSEKKETVKTQTKVTVKK
ncbi:MAG TPA: hypothetical protein VFB97_00195 [Bacteroidales bacterium]|nr:hypothetical protein [Bacteroidales bacterium]